MTHNSFYETLMKNPEAQYPNNSDVFERKLKGDLLISITILGQKGHLLIEPTDNGFVPKHFNKRFSANNKDSNYQYEYDFE
jgi:hypothetical protein